MLHTELTSCERTFSTCTPSAGSAEVSKLIASSASLKFPSKASIGVPLPSPGSLSQKNSASVTVISGAETTDGSMTIATRKTGPQLLFWSFTRIPSVCVPKPGSAVVLRKMPSTASSNAPSSADIAVALPAPGSVSQKYSALSTRCADAWFPNASASTHGRIALANMIDLMAVDQRSKETAFTRRVLPWRTLNGCPVM
ncbi:MAG: hypothetical protein IPG92_17695 [Flavobacteriales bacterium]|nr:hypothetical protein [Flavobacteriales bacterium]